MTNKTQCFLLHFAGGSCYSFDFLKKYVHFNIEFIPLELPGRGKRSTQPLITDKKAAIDDYFQQIRLKRNRYQDYLVFGHSMGATLGLSVVKKMEAIGDIPSCLVVSGNSGPGIEEVQAEIKANQRHAMSDDDFKNELREIGGVSDEVLDNQELYEYYSPILRADFQLLETDGFMEKGTQIKAPIYALMGTQEKYNVHIENWKNFTRASCHSETLEGGHFFIYDHAQRLGELIEKLSQRSFAL